MMSNIRKAVHKLPIFRGNLNSLKTLRTILFIVIRVALWVITFIACIPAPMEWLRGVVVESGVDREICIYYFRGDAILFGLYIINLIVWSLPFVNLRKMWYVLRVDILSLFVAILLLTGSYLIYIEYRM